MNNENDIIKEFNNTFNKEEQSVEAYKAVQNQNVISQPQMQNVQNNNQSVVMPGFSQVQNEGVVSSQAINNQINTVQNNSVMSQNNSIPLNNAGSLNVNVQSNQNVNITNMPQNGQQLYNTTNYINNEQEVVKKKKTGIKINPELKGMFILVLVLLISMAFIPTIFDLFNDLKLKIFG